MSNLHARHLKNQGNKPNPKFFKQSFEHRPLHEDKGAIRFQKTEDSARTKFAVNPVIVTQRNTSTARKKPMDDDEDEDDLLYTSGCLKNTQQLKRPTFLKQQQSQSFNEKITRPQSKQQPKRKCWNNHEILNLKRGQIQRNDRPETSKGQRAKTNQSQKSEGRLSQKSIAPDTKIKQQGKQVGKEYGGKGSSQAAKLLFKTAIDTQFLSLFAN